MIYKLIEPTNFLLNTRMEDFTIQYLKDTHSMTPAELLEALAETMTSYGGIGLSANQCGIPIRAFAMYMNFDQHNKDIALFMNPKVIWESEDTELFKEGCLTYPNLFLNVRRPKTIEFTYTDKDGNEAKSKFSGLTARIFQHEYDHMEGTNFTKLVSKLKLEMGMKKALKISKKRK
tara:strand:- start:804 stop:1331 length:528 start_codon:yes stop_codon:yes gene_type:complete